MRAGELGNLRLPGNSGVLNDLYLYILQELLRPVVHDEFRRESHFFNEWHDPAVVCDLERYVGVAAENEWHVVLLAKPQYFEVVVFGAELAAFGRQGVIVDFQ